MVSDLFPFTARSTAHETRTWTFVHAGISVYAPSDAQTGRPSSQELGKSSIAGSVAVGQTAASRVLTNM